MTPALQILTGDCRDLIKTLPDESVQCIVTSPPYWGLRDYGHPKQIGLEPTFEEYVEVIVAFFRGCRRVLRKHGTLWLNMGDSYAGSWGAQSRGEEAGDRSTLSGGQIDAAPRRTQTGSTKRTGLPAKNLLGQPWRVAFALQSDGWILRQDIIWSKPQPMPESVTDRCCKSHEYIFLFAKTRYYYFDPIAIQEPAAGTAHSRGSGVNPKCAGFADGSGSHKSIDHAKPGGIYKESLPGRNGGPGQDRRSKKQRQNSIWSEAVTEVVSTRNKRSVWAVPTFAFPGAHFATFPPDLIKPCILAGTSARGCCAKCGKPYWRIIEIGEPDRAHQAACGGDRNGEYHGEATKDFVGAKAQDASATKARILAGMRAKKTVDWKAGCTCGAGVIPCTVFDPFGGSGTTGAVSLELGRSAILFELSPHYVAIAEKRTHVTPGLAL